MFSGCHFLSYLISPYSKHFSMPPRPDLATNARNIWSKYSRLHWVPRSTWCVLHTRHLIQMSALHLKTMYILVTMELMLAKARANTKKSLWFEKLLPLSTHKRSSNFPPMHYLQLFQLQTPYHVNYTLLEVLGIKSRRPRVFKVGSHNSNAVRYLFKNVLINC